MQALYDRGSKQTSRIIAAPMISDRSIKRKAEKNDHDFDKVMTLDYQA
jgi:hypothetical protein